LWGWLVLRSGDLGSEVAGGGVVAVAVVWGVVYGLLHLL
jgi:hypothetical protein